MTHSQEHRGSGGDMDSVIVLLIASIALVLLVWFVLHDQFVGLMLAMLKLEARLINIFGFALTGEARASLSHWRLVLDNTRPADVDAATLWYALAEGGRWIAAPVFILGLLMAITVYLKSRAVKYRRVMTYADLKRRNAVIWPRTRPVANIDLVSKTPGEKTRQLGRRLNYVSGHEAADPQGRAWGGALSPIRFCVAHDLLKDRHGNLCRDPEPAGDNQLDEARACEVFAAQPGAAWGDISADGAAPYDPQRLPPMIRALCIALWARIRLDKTGADALLDRMGGTFKQGQNGEPHRMTLNGLDTQLLAKHKGHPGIMAIMKRHYHVNNVMAALLTEARQQAGILGGSDFIWLKTVDRTLFYVLNQVGRRVAWAEAAGARSHADAEALTGQAIMAPQVDTAVAALKAELQGEGWLVI